MSRLRSHAEGGVDILQPEVGGIRVCGRCGEDNSEGARFCVDCGQPLAEASAEGSRGFRKVATMLFCDVAGSTALASRVDAEVHSHVLSAYYEAMKPLVEQHGGRVEKFIGDALVAVFGVPESHEDDALRACRAAVAMRGRLGEFNAELERTRGLVIETRTGITTGPVTGRGLAYDGSLIAGDTGNTASRLQGAAEPCEILLGQATHRLVRDAVEAELLPPLQLKGKPDPVTAYRLLRVRADAEAMPRRLDAPLVGRERELERLSLEFQRAVDDGDCRLATVVGEAGAGKSRLVREFIARIGDKARVLDGRCLAYGDGITYWPLVEIVNEAASVADEDTAAEALEKLQSLVGDAQVAEHVSGLMGLTDRQPPPGVVAHAVRSLIERLAERRPLVAVFDDVQWAEPTLLDLLEYLSARATAPVLIVCISRPELLNARPDWPGVINLHLLSNDKSNLLVRALFHGAAIPAEALQLIVRAGGGNPLFCEQMASMLIDEGLLRREEGGWFVGGDLSAVAVPPTLQALLAARLDRLAPDEYRAITRAAVAGEEFALDAVRELVPEVRAARLESLLATLTAKGLIVRRPGAGQGYAFGHLLIRDVAYETLTKDERAFLHERFGNWLSRSGGYRVSEYDQIVGYHLEQAHRYLVELYPADARARAIAARACELLTRAGRRAWRRGDVAATSGLLTRGLDLMDGGDPRRAMLLLDIGDAMILSGRYDEMEEAFTRVSEVATEGRDDRCALIAQLSMLTARVVFDPAVVDLDAALEQGRGVLQRFEDVGDDLGIARACRLLFHVHETRAQYGAAAAVQERGLEPARRAGDVFLRFDLPNVVMAHRLGPTPTSVAIARGLELLERAGDDRLTAAFISAELGVLYAMRGEWEQGRSLIHDAIVEFEESGHIRDTAELRRYLATVEALAGDWPASESESRQTYETAVATGERSLVVEAAMMIGQALSQQGHLIEAAAFASIARTEEASLKWYWLIGLRRLQARLSGLNGAYAEARRLARQAVATAADTDSLWARADALMDLADVLERSDGLVEARKVLEQAGRTYQQKEHLVGAKCTKTLLAARVTG